MPGIDQSSEHHRNFPRIILFVTGFLIFMMCGPFLVSGQNFGGVPPGDSWMVSESADARIIYSRKTSPLADTVLSVIARVNRHSPLSLGGERLTVPIILRNKNLTTNGFVAYVPFRSELNLHASQNPNVLGYYDWMTILTLHEYRHVLQYSAGNKGLTRLVGKVFGEGARAGLYNLLVPDWFSEGDAVFFESAVTGAGRGQLPAFTADIRALLLANIKYDYHKFRNGSFRDLVPNHYVHGFLLTEYGNRKDPGNFWPKVMDETTRFKGLFVPFRQAIRRNAGLKLPKFHHVALNAYQDYLFETTDTVSDTAPLLLPESENIKDELQLLIDSAGGKYLLETSYDEISTFYKLVGDRKKKLFSPGRSFDNHLLLRGSRIIFTSRGLHPRWTNREYSDIYSYHLPTGKLDRITRHAKYLSADYQPFTNRYVAVQAGEDGQTTLVIFRGQDLTVDTIFHENNSYLAEPRWLDASTDKVLFVQRKNGRSSLCLYDPAVSHIEILLGPSKETIARPFVSTHGIFYSSSSTGIDNIHFFDFRTHTSSVVTHVPTGAYNPTTDPTRSAGDSVRLYYSIATAYGQRIRTSEIPLPNGSASFRTAQEAIPERYFNLPTGNAQIVQGEAVDAEKEIYHPARHLFRFHSLYLEPSLTDPGFAILSNDYLNTTKARLYTRYIDPDQSWKVGAEVTYAARFPEIILGVNHRFNRHLNLRLEDEVIRLPKSETSVEAGIALPLDFSRRQTNHILRIQGQYGWTQEHFDQNDPVLPGPIDLEPRLFQTGIVGLQWSVTRQHAYRDILPKWGLTTTLSAKRGFSPAESWLLYAGQNLYLPGLFRNDGLKFKWQVQHGSTSAANFLTYELRSIQDLPYDIHSFRTGAVLTGNYIFPLAYPEISIPHVLYTQRLAINFFTEHFHSVDNQATWSGVDLFLTARYFNLSEFTTGIRVSRQWGDKSSPFSWNVLFLQDL